MKKLILSLTLLLITCGVLLYLTPYMALGIVKSAIKEKDTNKVLDYIDLTSIKDKLRTDFNDQIASYLAESNNNNLSIYVDDSLITEIINKLVTLQGLKEIYEKSIKLNPIMKYENFNNFILTYRENNNQEIASFVFSRENVIFWKLSSLRLPTHDIKNLVQLSSKQKWFFKTTFDKFTDEKISVATVNSDEGKGFIHIGCYSGNNIEIKIGTGEYIGENSISKNVIYRIDKQPSVTLTMSSDKSFVYGDISYSELFKHGINYVDYKQLLFSLIFSGLKDEIKLTDSDIQNNLKFKLKLHWFLFDSLSEKTLGSAESDADELMKELDKKVELSTLLKKYSYLGHSKNFSFWADPETNNAGGFNKPYKVGQHVKKLANDIFLSWDVVLIEDSGIQEPDEWERNVILYSKIKSTLEAIIDNNIKISELKDNKDYLLFQLTSYDNTISSARFSLNGATQSILKVLAMCSNK